MPKLLTLTPLVLVGVVAAPALTASPESAAARPLEAVTPVVFADDAVTVTEGATRELTLVRTVDTGPGAVPVDSTPVTATSGADYKRVSAVVEFGAGELRKTIPVEALTDSLPEKPETFNVTIGEGKGGVVAGTPATAVVTVKDPDPVVVQSDRDAPVVGPVKLSPRRFSAGRGTTISYSLSEPATVTLRVKRAGKVRRTLTGAGTLGANRVPFDGRTLRRGRYRIVVTATDAAGNASAPVARRFRIVR
jgi:hypothetical protein